jgi:hypothetical protein
MDRNELKKLKDAIEQLEVVPRGRGLADKSIAVVDAYKLDIVTAAARTLLPPVIEYWVVEHIAVYSDGSAKVCAATFDTERDARAFIGNQPPATCRIRGPLKWDMAEVR